MILFLRCILCCTFRFSPVIYFSLTRLHFVPEHELVFVASGLFYRFAHLSVHGTGRRRGFREGVVPVREEAHNRGNKANHPPDNYVLYVVPLRRLSETPRK